MAVIEHTHENILNGGSLGKAALIRSDVSFSGSLGVNASVGFAMNPDAFMPMVHSSTGVGIMAGHTSDGGSPDSPRFGMYNLSGISSLTYDMDYRYISG